MENLIKDKENLLSKKHDLEQELQKVNKTLRHIENLEKPYVANVQAYSGHFSTKFKTEEKARKKLEEYAKKIYFKNGLNYGVYLYKYREDGTKEVLESMPINMRNFGIKKGDIL